jgi:hypothetical protein
LHTSSRSLSLANPDRVRYDVLFAEAGNASGASPAAATEADQHE